MDQEILDKHVHHRLQEDLVEYSWALKQNAYLFHLFSVSFSVSIDGLIGF
jgi:hypothetical protein